MEMLKNWISFILGFICLIFLLGLLVGCDNSQHEQQQLMTQQQQLMQQQLMQQQLMSKEIKELDQQIEELQDYCDYLESEMSYIYEILN